jgi:hypothetical protein
MKSNQLGELILTNCYLKDKNLIQIRVQQINQLKIKFPSKGIDSNIIIKFQILLFSLSQWSNIDSLSETSLDKYINIQHSFIVSSY